jgi:drug/metabolite transporter (DMT)-like permease
MAQIYILLAIFLWSSLGIVVRLSGVAVHVLTFYSLVVAVVLQTPFLLYKGFRPAAGGLIRLRYPVFLGIVGTVNTLAFFYAYKTTTVANAVLTHYTAPVLVAFLAPFFLKERVTAAIIAAISIASIGLLVMLNDFSVGAGEAAGIIAGCVSGLAYAVIIIMGRLYAKEFSPFLLTYVVNITILFLLVPFVREFPVHALWSFLVMGIVHSTIAPIFYYRGLREVPANRAAVLGYLEPVCAILLSMIFLNETPGSHSLFGGALILLSGYLTIRSDPYAT